MAGDHRFSLALWGRALWGTLVRLEARSEALWQRVWGWWSQHWQRRWLRRTLKFLVAVLFFYLLFIKGTPNPQHPEEVLDKAFDVAAYGDDVEAFRHEVERLFPYGRNGEQLLAYLNQNWEQISVGNYDYNFLIVPSVSEETLKTIPAKPVPYFTPNIGQPSHADFGFAFGFYHILSRHQLGPMKYAFHLVPSYVFRKAIKRSDGLVNQWIITIFLATNGDLIKHSEFLSYDLDAERFAERGVPFRYDNFIEEKNATIAMDSVVRELKDFNTILAYLEDLDPYGIRVDRRLNFNMDISFYAQITSYLSGKNKEAFYTFHITQVTNGTFQIKFFHKITNFLNHLHPDDMLSSPLERGGVKDGKIVWSQEALPLKEAYDAVRNQD